MSTLKMSDITSSDKFDHCSKLLQINELNTKTIVDSHETREYDETYNNKDKSINGEGIFNDILVDDSKIQSNIKTNIKYEACTEADEAESDENIKSNFRGLYDPIDCDKKIFEIDIEDNLKCNFSIYENYNKIRMERAKANIDDDSQIKDYIDVNIGQVTPQVQAAICLNGNQNDDSDTCSYHSSDFEFIDEPEAFNGCTEGLMYNLSPSTKGIINNSQITEDISRELHTNVMNESLYYNKPGPNGSINNVIPRGVDYNKLFQHPCVPYPSRNIENKTVHSMKVMNVCNATFDMKFLLHQTDSNSKLKEEADVSAKIIVSMYPYENKRISLKAKGK